MANAQHPARLPQAVVHHGNASFGYNRTILFNLLKWSNISLYNPNGKIHQKIKEYSMKFRTKENNFMCSRSKADEINMKKHSFQLVPLSKAIKSKILETVKERRSNSICSELPTPQIDCKKLFTNELIEQRVATLRQGMQVGEATQTECANPKKFIRVPIHRVTIEIKK